jgi:hypothetical protein
MPKLLAIMTLDSDVFFRPVPLAFDFLHVFKG